MELNTSDRSSVRLGAAIRKQAEAKPRASLLARPGFATVCPVDLSPQTAGRGKGQASRRMAMASTAWAAKPTTKAMVRRTGRPAV